MPVEGSSRQAVGAVPIFRGCPFLEELREESGQERGGSSLAQKYVKSTLLYFFGAVSWTLLSGIALGLGSRWTDSGLVPRGINNPDYTRYIHYSSIR